jgi:hypothetical protein
MEIKTLSTLAATLLLTLTTTGCVGISPYTTATDAWAKASEDGAKSVATAPASAGKLCTKKAQMTYVQKKLTAHPEVTWSEFYVNAKEGATPTQSWEAYCKEIEATGKLFNVALGALTQYSSALKALAEAGQYDGSDINSMSASAAAIAGSLGDSNAAAKIKPVGALVATFAGLLLGQYTESRLKEYVIKADPLVKPIFDQLDTYLVALDKEFLEGVESSDRQALLAIETKTFPAGQPVEAPKLMQFFYPLALSFEDDIRQNRAVFGGYRAVIQRMRGAHQDLFDAGKASDPPDVKKALGTISDLLTQLQALKTALATKE